MAVSGDYMSAASFLGISGLIALNGLRRLPLLDRVPRRLAGGAPAGGRAAAQLRAATRWPTSSPTGCKQRPGAYRAATSTVVVSIFYLLAQMVAPGALVTLLLGVESESVKALVIVGVGLLMIFYVTVGGHEGHDVGARSSRRCC
jgi:cation/acetate symporter